LQNKLVDEALVRDTKSLFEIYERFNVFVCVCVYEYTNLKKQREVQIIWLKWRKSCQWWRKHTPRFVWKNLKVEKWLGSSGCLELS